MAENSSIEWTNHTFNPWVGCAKVSPACDHCYAEGWAKRAGTPELWQGQRRRTSAANWRQPLKWDLAAQASGKRARVFCASLADVFDNHQAITDDWRQDLGALIRATPNLDWLLLSKRIGNAGRYLPQMFPNGVPETVWLGATVCNQAGAVRDIPKLLAAPAGVRFLSAEPLLSALDLREWLVGIDLLIVGGESGGQARPMHPDWVRGLRDQCAAAGTAFFFKQWGEWAPSVGKTEVFSGRGHFIPDIAWPDGTIAWGRADDHGGPGLSLHKVGKKEAGRLLDGHEWNEVVARKRVHPGLHLIRRHGLWFRPEAKGYTSNLSEAGVFDADTARGYLCVEGLSVVPLDSLREMIETEINRMDRARVGLEALLEKATAAKPGDE